MINEKKLSKAEILSPAGNFDSVVAGVRCGANAVYLGGSSFSARSGAQNFDKIQLKEAVSYCHGRDVKVHMAINTIIFDNELNGVVTAIKEGADAGVDAFIIQDLAAAKIARECTEIELHGSTQMAVHNLAGVSLLKELGFSRVVLARELTLQEIEHIRKNSDIELECFVHGALCMSVSGQCYISSMIGGRSGNRGRCAQTCRLPFKSGGSTHGLSLKDLSIIDSLPILRDMGINSFKIEGRLKRPEYVAAAVTACKDVLMGKKPDYEVLQNIFSRSGFTDGYLNDTIGDNMFGTRRKEDVVSVGKNLKELAGLYYQEQPLISVDFDFKMKKDEKVALTATSRNKAVTVYGDYSQVAINVPTDFQKVRQSLEKTGNTPFFMGKLNCEIEDGLMIPVSGLNALRREALNMLLEELEKPQPKSFVEFKLEKPTTRSLPEHQKTRVRLAGKHQLSKYLEENADEIILPVYEIDKLDDNIIERLKDKLIGELPRMAFKISTQNELKTQLESIKKKGINRGIASELGGIALLKSMGFDICGDFTLNAVNYIAVEEYGEMGLSDITMSIEYPLNYKEPESPIPKGVVAYGKVPLMIFRNKPAGLGDGETLVDRKGIEFSVRKSGDVWVLYNSVTMYWGDKLDDLKNFDFITLYFTKESSLQCEEIIKSYQKGLDTSEDYTRGLYLRRID